MLHYFHQLNLHLTLDHITLMCDMTTYSDLAMDLERTRPIPPPRGRVNITAELHGDIAETESDSDDKHKGTAKFRHDYKVHEKRDRARPQDNKHRQTHNWDDKQL